jgi:hypothetical protein
MAMLLACGTTAALVREVDAITTCLRLLVTFRCTHVTSIVTRR